jgi:protein arginine N-methyltransferase 2
MNNAEAYEALLGEGVRAEMLRAVLEATAAADEPGGDGGDDEEEGEGEPVASTSGTKSGGGDDDTAMEENGGEEEEQQQQKLSTASDNATFLSSRLLFTHDASGQPVALDAEGNGVMMGWETGIMRRTADRLCEDGWRDRKESEGGKSWHDLVEEEERGEREPLRVMNVGFGLGIVSLLRSLCGNQAVPHRRGKEC